MTNPARLPVPHETQATVNASAPTLGRLTTQTTITIQTHVAVRLFRGRRGDRDRGVQPIMGLFAFADRVNQMFAAAQADDPWADQGILRLEQALESAQGTFATAKANADARFEAWRASAADSGIQCGGPVETAGVDIALQFSTPFAYMLAMLIGDLDHVSRVLLTGQQFGFVTAADGHRIREKLSHTLRSTMMIAASWRHTGVTRTDVTQMTQRAAQAEQLMGSLNSDIVSGARRSTFAPNIVTEHVANVTPFPTAVSPAAKEESCT